VCQGSFNTLAIFSGDSAFPDATMKVLFDMGLMKGVCVFEKFTGQVHWLNSSIRAKA
jgi:hypothetical protein